MKIGAVFPHLDIGNDPAVIRHWAQTAEGLGYSHILAYDHVIGAVHEGREPPLWGPYTEQSAFHEPFVLFGYLAACTTKVELATGIVILPQRQTVLVAKQAAEIDLLSGGRLRLGVGTGWNYVEFEALNEDFGNRGARQAEQVALLRQLWAEPVLDYSGRWHRIERAGLKPLPGRSIPSGSAASRMRPSGEPPESATASYLAPVRRPTWPRRRKFALKSKMLAGIRRTLALRRCSTTKRVLTGGVRTLKPGAPSVPAMSPCVAWPCAALARAWARPKPTSTPCKRIGMWSATWPTNSV